MAKYCSECGASLRKNSESRDQNSVARTTTTKRKRAPSKYNTEYSKQFAKLKKKHPRTKFSTLAKRAHKATKRVMK